MIHQVGGGARMALKMKKNGEHAPRLERRVWKAEECGSK